MDVHYELKRKEAVEIKKMLDDKINCLSANQQKNYVIDAVFGVAGGFTVAYAYTDFAVLYSTSFSLLTTGSLCVSSTMLFLMRLLGEKRGSELKTEVDSLERKMESLKKYIA